MEQLTTRQFRILVILHTIGTSLELPGMLMNFTKQDTWLVVPLTMLINLPLIYLFGKLGKLYPSQNLAEITETVLGKWLGKLCNLNFFLFGFLNTNALIWYTGNFISSKLVVEAPIPYIQLTFILLLVLTLSSGLKTMGRLAELCFPVIIVIFTILFFLITPKLKFEQLFPIFEHDWRSLLKASLICSAYIGWPLINFLFFYPSEVQHNHQAKQANFFGGYLFGANFLLILFIITIITMGNMTSQTTNSSYMLTMLIPLTGIFERMEKVLALIWFSTVFFKALLYYYTTVVSLAQIFQLKNYHSLALALGLVLIPLSLVIYPNTVYQANWALNTWFSYALVTGALVPICLLIIGKLKQLFQD